MRTLRPYRDGDFTTTLDIINAAAQAYRDVIPPDRWHEPYMPAQELETAVSQGVSFTVCEENGELLGVMGMQRVRDVELIRHAYVRPGLQRGGVGSGLLRHLCERADRPLFVGTWADARWAVDFYRRNGFEPVTGRRAQALLREYWTIPERQIETSAVLEYREAPRPV
jgi:GNAT superfamily N-acetyltransferase